MKNNRLSSFLEELKKINLTGKAGYAVAKNRKLIEAELEALQETVKATKSFEKYENERVELAKKHAKKDEKGEPVVSKPHPLTGQTSFVIEKQEQFDKEYEKLKETHKEALEEREKQINDYNAFLQEDIKIELHKIEESDIPETATAEEIYTLLEIVNGKN